MRKVLLFYCRTKIVKKYSNPYGLNISLGDLGISEVDTQYFDKLTEFPYCFLASMHNYLREHYCGKSLCSSYNEVPITAIARGIEIDLREMIDDTNIPKPTETVDGFLM